MKNILSISFLYFYKNIFTLRAGQKTKTELRMACLHARPIMLFVFYAATAAKRKAAGLEPARLLTAQPSSAAATAHAQPHQPLASPTPQPSSAAATAHAQPYQRTFSQNLLIPLHSFRHPASLANFQLIIGQIHPMSQLISAFF